MASYIPPTAILSIFDTLVFTKADDPLTITDGNALYKTKARTAYGQFSYETAGAIAISQSPSITKPTFTTAIHNINCGINPTTTQLRVDITGDYRIGLSPNINATGSTTLDFWFIKNGTSIPSTGSRLTTKSGSDLPYVEIIEYLNAGDYIEFGFSSSSTSTQLLCVAATPPVPLIPALIVTMTLMN